MRIPFGSLIVMIASVVSVIVSVAMFFVVLWQSPRSRDNQLVAIYLGAVTIWSASAFLARFAPVVGTSPSPFGYQIATGIGMTGLALLAVAGHYARLWKHWWLRLLVGAGTIYLLVMIPYSYSARLFGEFHVLADGQLEYQFTSLALFNTGLFYTFTLIGVLILWLNRRDRAGNLLYGGLAVILGMVFSLIPPVTKLALPIICALLSSLFFARAILQENLFNPLAELNRELAATNEELAQANQLKSQFLANMSHELRTPLNSINGYTEMLLNEVYGPLTDEQRDRLYRVQRNGQSLLALINDVLDLSKIEAGRVELDLLPIQLETVINVVCSVILPLASERGLTVSQDISPDLPPLLADEARLRQILTNLLSNAIKFTEIGEVSIRASADTDGQQIRIAVADTGIGIPKESFDDIFSEFQQVDGSSTRQHGGTGLGLAISRRLARMHGGDILVESQPGKGSTFTVILPVTDHQVRSTSQ